MKGYFGYGHAESPLPSTLTPYWNYGPQRNQNYSAILNTVISPHLTNQVSFGMNIIYLFFEDKDTNFNPVALGLNTGVTGSYLAGSPKINISNFDPLGPFPPYGRREFVPQWNEALSYVKGAHQMRFGGEFRRVRYNDLTLRSARGTFNFNGSQGPWSATPAPHVRRWPRRIKASLVRVPIRMFWPWRISWRVVFPARVLLRVIKPARFM